MSKSFFFFFFWQNRRGNAIRSIRAADEVSFYLGSPFIFYPFSSFFLFPPELWIIKQQGLIGGKLFLQSCYNTFDAHFDLEWTIKILTANKHSERCPMTRVWTVLISYGLLLSENYATAVGQATWPLTRGKVITRI